MFMLGRCSEVVLWDARTHEHLRTLHMQGRVTAMIVMGDDAAGHDDGVVVGGGACCVVIAMDDGEGGGALAVMRPIEALDGSGSRWGVAEGTVARPLASGGSNVHITCMARGPSCIGCGCR